MALTDIARLVRAQQPEEAYECLTGQQGFYAFSELPIATRVEQGRDGMLGHCMPGAPLCSCCASSAALPSLRLPTCLPCVPCCSGGEQVCTELGGAARQSSGTLPLGVCNCWTLQRCCCLAVQLFSPVARLLSTLATVPFSAPTPLPHSLAPPLQACNNWGLVLQDLSSLRPSAERLAYLHHSLSKFRRAIHLRPDFDRACEACAACDWQLHVVRQLQPAVLACRRRALASCTSCSMLKSTCRFPISAIP